MLGGVASRILTVAKVSPLWTHNTKPSNHSVSDMGGRPLALAEEMALRTVTASDFVTTVALPQQLTKYGDGTGLQTG